MILSTHVRPVRWPLKRPFVTALGRKSFSDNVLVGVRLSGGAEGWGEASSSLAMPWQTGPKMAAALRRLGRRFKGRDPRDWKKISVEAWRAEPELPTAVGAFECAVVDALCHAEGVPFNQFFGGAGRELKTLMSVSAASPDEVSARVRAGRRQGFDAFKLKLNGRESSEENLARVRAARRAAPRARLLLDPNQSYRPDSLEELLGAIRREGHPVVLVEEPFPKKDWAALKSFRRKNKFPLLLDESIQGPGDAVKVRRGKWADGANVKLAKSGLERSLKIVDAFRGSLLMIGCMAESPVGLAAAAQFAMGTGAFDHADLDSDLLLKPTGVRGGYRRRGPWLSLPRRPAPGLAVFP